MQTSEGDGVCKQPALAELREETPIGSQAQSDVSEKKLKFWHQSSHGRDYDTVFLSCSIHKTSQGVKLPILISISDFYQVFDEFLNLFKSLV